MTTTTDKTQVKTITITRAEGLTALCYASEHGTWEGAEERIRAICQTAPKTGGYDKTDFRIEWQDGAEFVGRYDATHPEAKGFEGTLADHVRHFLKFESGEHCPHWMKPEHYREIMEHNGPEQQKAARDFLKEYQIGGSL